MKIKILAVGKQSEYFRELAEEYLARLPKYCRIEVQEIRESTKMEEGKQLLAKIKDDEYAIALERVGDAPYTEDFAQFLKNKNMESNICFILGGSEGLSGEVLKRSQKHLSLSNMTFPHQLARVMILEQIYRAFTIMKGEKYHK
ncbi:MAG: 23S rRNA (pseudouridine(1915)-N(3))-methyltransferase RlmH [Nanoarchaeota archaeon]